MMAETLGSSGTADERSPAYALGLIVFATSIFSVQDVIIRLLGGSYPLMQLLFLRGILVIALMIGFLAVRGALTRLRPTRAGLLALRAILVYLSFTLYYLALISIPIAASTAIYYVAPLILTGLAAFIGKEHVGPLRWSAVGVGLIGVIVIMRPGADAIDPAAFLALGGAFCYACFNLMTRRLSATESVWSLSFSHNLGYVLISGLLGLALGSGSFAADGHPAIGFMTRAWIVPTPVDGLLIAATGVIATVGFLCLTEGYRSAPSSLAAPFEYVIIPWSVFWGLVIWNETPHAMTWIGIVLVIGSGLFVIYRERKRGQRVVTRRFTRWRP